MAPASRAAPAAPGVTVVVPTLDEGSCISGLLSSLGKGVGDDAVQEIIVSDGGSHDDTLEIARAAGARLVTGAAGRGAQLARGAALARTEFLFFVHADSRLRPGSLRALRQATRDSRVVACGLSQQIEHEGRIFRWIERMADRRVSWGWIYGDSGLFCRRSGYEEVGGYRPLPIFEDLDLSRRLKRVGVIRLVQEARIRISSRRWEREGPLRRTFKNWCLTLAWAAGVAPERLVRFYRPHVAPEEEKP